MDEKTLKSLETMAKFNLTDGERVRAAGAFALLEAGFRLIEQAETGDAQPLVSVLDLKNVLREDAASKPVPRETLLALAPDTQDGYFKVPKTLE